MATLSAFAARFADGFIPKLDFELAKILVNEAWIDINQERLWTFNVAEGLLLIPSAVTAGTVTVTQYTTSGNFAVVGDAVASAAWLPLLLVPVPFTKLQFSLGPGNPIYNIVNVDPSNPAAIRIDLDQTYVGGSGALQTYQIFQCYISPPIADFKRWVSIWDPTNGYTIHPKRPYWNRALLNIYDPMRSNQGQPIRIVPYKADVLGNPMWEMWPAQTSQTPYPCNFERKGVPLTANQCQPTAVPDTVMVLKSEMKCFKWAIANAGRYPELRGVDWRLLMQSSKNEYDVEIAKAKKNDEETFLQNFVIPRNRLYPMFPIDGKYLQSHDPW